MERICAHEVMNSYCMDIRMDIGLNIVLYIRWLIPFSRWLTLELNSRNYELRWRNGDNMCARINGLKLHEYPHEPRNHGKIAVIDTEIVEI